MAKAPKKPITSQIVKFSNRQVKTMKQLLDAAEKFNMEARAAQQRLQMYLQNTRDTYSVPEAFVAVKLEEDMSAVTFSLPSKKEEK